MVPSAWSSFQSSLVLVLLLLIASKSQEFERRKEGSSKWGILEASSNRVKFPDDNENTQLVQSEKLSRRRDFEETKKNNVPNAYNDRRLDVNDVPICKNTTFCEEPSHYPEELVKLVLRSAENYKYSPSVDEMEENEEIEGRIDSEGEFPACNSKVQIVYPRTAENRHNQWLYIVNHDSFKQGIRVEMCESDKCHQLVETPNGYVAKCKQQYVYRRLTAISNGSLKEDNFRFPSGCKAYIHFTDY